MGGPAGATPQLDAEALVAGIPGARRPRRASRRATSSTSPSAHLTLGDQLQICREARDAARRGIGVVVTHGTDALEETAMLCDVIHDAEAPIVFTGAIRPATAPGADGPANLLDASRRRQRGGGRDGRAGRLRRRDPPRALRAQDRHDLAGRRSPRPRPARSGRVTEGHPTIWSRLPRNPPLDPPDLDRRVLIVPTTSGDDGTLARAALATEPDGVVIGTLGAGHLAPALLELWAEAAERIPVVAYCRPERGVVLSGTYGYAGSERDLRGTKIIPAGFLSPQAARMKLLACVAAGLTIDEIRWAFRQDDG